MNCPHCDKKLTEAQIRSLWGQLSTSKRETFGAGPGRPRTAARRCKCGEFTLARAKQRHHKCVL
jgi:hypothetical protein